MVRGTVIEFDEASGLGRIAAVDGTTYRFHCIEIADGTRTIPVGEAVEFELRRKFGTDEAANLRPLP